MNNILIVEDDPTTSLLLSSYLEKEKLTSHIVDNGFDALDYIRNNSVDIVLMDLGLPDINGIELITEALQIDKTIEIVVVTGESSADVALEAVRLGAKDYLVKPITGERLLITVKNITERIELNRKVKTLESQDGPQKNFKEFIGLSNHMQDVYSKIEAAAKNNEAVFIHGEHGTGKKLCAQTVHSLSEREDLPFETLDGQLLDNENAEIEFQNALAQASGGTLYIAHVASLPINVQRRLMKALEDDENNVRFIASSVQPALDSVKQGALREDLYYRLNILAITLPPLRQRGDDIDLLASFFLREYARDAQKGFKAFNANALALMKDHHWPGNVRELQNIVKNIVLMNDDAKVVTQRMLPKDVFRYNSQAANQNKAKTLTSGGGLFSSNLIIPIRDLEMMAIEHALEICNGNVQEAAARLKISPATLYRKKPSDEEKALS